MTSSEQSESVLVVRRTIAAPRERVFRAWLEPADLARFMQPGDVTHVIAEVDARIGGGFRIVMEHGRGNAEHRGTYLVIEPPSLLSFTWISGSTETRETVVTVELTERSDGATDLVLTHRGLSARVVAAHRDGWGAIANKLAALVTA